MVDDLLKVLTVNLQFIPYICNVIECCNELLFIVWVTVTLPANEVRPASIARQSLHFNRSHLCKDSIKCICWRIVKPEVETNLFHMISEHLAGNQ